MTKHTIALALALAGAVTAGQAQQPDSARRPARQTPAATAAERLVVYKSPT